MNFRQNVKLGHVSHQLLFSKSTAGKILLNINYRHINIIHFLPC